MQKYNGPNVDEVEEYKVLVGEKEEYNVDEIEKYNVDDIDMVPMTKFQDFSRTFQDTKWRFPGPFWHAFAIFTTFMVQ